MFCDYDIYFKQRQIKLRFWSVFNHISAIHLLFVKCRLTFYVRSLNSCYLLIDSSNIMLLKIYLFYANKIYKTMYAKLKLRYLVTISKIFPTKGRNVKYH